MLRRGLYFIGQSIISKDTGGHSFSAYAKFSEKLTWLTPWYAHVTGWKKY